jgi:hypothetical protein
VNRPPSGVEIAARLNLPLNVYHESVVFRSNLIELGFTTNLADAGRSIAIVLYGKKFAYRVTIRADWHAIEAQPLDGGTWV